MKFNSDKGFHRIEMAHARREDLRPTAKMASRAIRSRRSSSMGTNSEAEITDFEIPALDRIECKSVPSLGVGMRIGFRFELGKPFSDATASRFARHKTCPALTEGYAALKHVGA